ncbi:hypothetical protein N7532_009486 [Penicillium argentinense]|uniref:Sulfatase N-terminal domain-containing protein n=1 Tax=Penicillium argentinense TaxID=1131581 RepID=A0A9W9EZG0_9EURO|nr:uncharacterized protein N7532_009486 [Penicillium argentinense]KAJ5090802.1 hypothetical protein N7532_009486 [Penicillium argentinense]
MQKVGDDEPPHTIPHQPSGLPNERPNVVIFMPDQLRYDALHCTGMNPVVQTPQIDKFASRGVRFSECYVQASVCSQSRCSMFTGLYPHVSGHRSLENLIKPWEPNLFRSLKDAGYHVACMAPRGDLFAPTVTELSLTEYGFLEPPEVTKIIGKNGNERPEDEISIWERLFYKGRRDVSKAVDYDEAAVRGAEQWLECPPDDKPWVLFLPLLFPHCPFTVEEPYFSMYKREEMPAPSSHKEKTGYEPTYMQMIRERHGTHRATPEIWAEVASTYHGMISRLDDQFGRIMDKIDATGLWSKTITMFFTDHGEYLGDHGLIEKWPSGLSETLVREPLIIAGGGIPAGLVRDSMTEMVDLVPTILQLCGIDETFPHNGMSLLPAILHDQPHREYSFSEGGFLLSEEPLLENASFPYDIKSGLQHEDTRLVGKAISMRDKHWTYIYRLYEPAELYDRHADPKELHNLAADPQYVHQARLMESRMFRWMVETSDFLPYTKDGRFPKVDLPDPKTLLDERKERRRNGDSDGLLSA